MNKDELVRVKQQSSLASAEYLLKDSTWRWLMLILIVTSSIAIRVYGIQKEPLLFHPVKQYRSAMTARALYYDSMGNSTVPGWKRDVTRANLRDIGILQPPVESWIAAQAYRVIGAEVLWVPRLLSGLSWMIGGIFLYFLARRLMLPDSALASLAFYLLLPFAVIASKSFQIDPLMVSATLASMYLIVRYDQSRSVTSLLFASLAASVAILLKPVSLFVLFAAFVGLRLSVVRPRQVLANWHALTFVVIGLAPAAIYYGLGIFVVEGVLQQQAVKSFVPAYFAEFRFWDGWLKRVNIVMGLTYFIGGLLGALVYRGRARVFLVALWVGYLMMCLVFNYTISTHDYYHLLLVPIVAISLGSLADIVVFELQRSGEQWYWRAASRAVLAMAILLAAGTSIQAERKQQAPDTQIRMAQEIGNMVAHSTATLYLAPEQGHSLLYYGEFSGRYWPYRYDLRDETLWLNRRIAVEERFKALEVALNPEFFVVADRDEFAAQADLQQFVVTHFPVVAETDEYMIFSLK